MRRPTLLAFLGGAALLAAAVIGSLEHRLIAGGTFLLFLSNALFIGQAFAAIGGTQRAITNLAKGVQGGPYRTQGDDAAV